MIFSYLILNKNVKSDMNRIKTTCLFTDFKGKHHFFLLLNSVIFVLFIKTKLLSLTNNKQCLPSKFVSVIENQTKNYGSNQREACSNKNL